MSARGEEKHNTGSLSNNPSHKKIENPIEIK